jgi:predicted lactoylglutathione lyase
MDQNNQTPPPATQPVQVVLETQAVSEPLTFVQKIKQDVSTLWEKDKIFLIVFGALILIAKFSSFMIDFYQALSKKEVDDATKQDAVLKAQEDANKAAADALVKQADDLGNQKTPVTEDWNVKKR